MNRWVLLLACASAGFHQCSAQQVTVQQLRQYLAQQQVAHGTDDAVARKLADAQLTERLTDLTLDRLEAEFHPGRKTTAALDLLADQSAFLAPPAGELPHKDPPDAAAQQAIIQAAVKFATVTVKRMPDFIATRSTRSFEDVPVITPGSVFQSGLHPMGTSIRETAYRNGREVAADTTAATEAHLPQGIFPVGLASIGEFGQDLAIILTDSSKCKFVWSHWEQTPAGLVAVFQYEVPKAASHYNIYFCCAWNSAANASTSYEGTPAYHGTLSIDPATGAILGVALEVEFEGFEPPPHYRIAVQYGAVDIGGHSSILPIRSVTIGAAATIAQDRYWNNLFIDEVRFTNYHQFGSTVRILPSSPSQ